MDVGEKEIFPTKVNGCTSKCSNQGVECTNCCHLSTDVGIREESSWITGGTAIDDKSHSSDGDGNV